MSCSKCDRPVKAKGLCEAHYQWERNHPGEVRTQMDSRYFTISERLTRKTTLELPDFSDPLVRLKPGCAPCKIFHGEKNNSGYGRIRVRGRKATAHVASYEEVFGPVPAGKEIDHLCRNRPCWEPSHLEPVTRKENTSRGLSVLLSPACRAGHAFDDENTYWNGGHRYCRKCRADYHRRRKSSSIATSATNQKENQ